MMLRANILHLLAACALIGGGGASADGIRRRDFQLIQSALNNVNSLLQQIDTSILALDTANIATRGPQLLQLGGSIFPTLSGVNAQIQVSQPLSLDETNGLNTARTALNKNVNLTVSDLLSKKPLFDSANLSTPVANTLQQVRDSSSTLFNTIQPKLDPSAPEMPALFTQALDVFDSAIATFRGQQASSMTSNPAAAAAAAGASSSAVNGTGVLSSDGTCTCMVVCPAGSFKMASV